MQVATLEAKLKALKEERVIELQGGDGLPRLNNDCARLM
jgi:hypothetical protein